MLGHPKYSYKDIVRFKTTNYDDFVHGKKPREAFCIGVIVIVDAYGTSEQKEEVSYDIEIPGVVLEKHVTEDRIVELIMSADPYQDRKNQ